VRRYDFPSPWWDEVSPQAKALISAMLTVDPKTRVTAAQTLANEWCATNTTKSLKGAQKSLKRYNAARKLKKAATALMGQKKIIAAMEVLKTMDSN
jgi:serine/threonine protein kinase